MPTVPLYGERKVQTQPLPAVRKQSALTEEAAGVGVERARAAQGAAISDLGQAGMQVAGTYFQVQMEARKRAAEIDATRAVNQAAEWRIRRMHDPQTGALNVRGMNAMGLPEQVMSEWDQVTGEIEAGLTTRQAREMFQKAKAQHGLALLESLSRHTSTEITAAEGEALAANVNNMRSIVAANATSPELVSMAIDETAAAIRMHGKNLGWTNEVIEDKIAGVESMGFKTATETLIEQGHTAAAKAYFEEVGHRITNPDDRDKIQAMLTRQTQIEESQSEGDRINALPLSLSGKLEEAKKVKPEIRRDVETYLKNEDTRKKAEQRDRIEETHKQALQLIHNGTPVNKLPAWMQQDLREYLPSLDAYEASRAARDEHEGNLELYYQMRDHARTESDNYKELNLFQLAPQLNKQQLSSLLELQQEMRGATPKAAKLLAGFGSEDAVFKNTMEVALGVDIDKIEKGTPLADAVATARALVTQRVDELQVGGQPVTHTEIQKITDEILSHMVADPASQRPSRWPSFFMPPPKRLIELTYEEIPLAERVKIEEALRAERRPVSIQTVREAYIKQQRIKAATK